MELVHRAGDDKMILVQHPEIPRGKGQGHKGQRLAAPQIQDVVRREFLVPLGALFLFGGADRRKQQPVFIQPGKAPLLAQIRELPYLALLIEPEPLFVAVVLLIGVGHYEGRPLPARRIADIGEKAIVQDVFQFDGFHADSPCFGLCLHYTARGKQRQSE